MAIFAFGGAAFVELQSMQAALFYFAMLIVQSIFVRQAASNYGKRVCGAGGRKGRIDVTCDLAPPAERLGSFALEVRMMVAIAVLELLEGHAKPPRGLPAIRALLHKPGCGGVAQRVPHYIFAEAGVLEDAFPG